MLGLHATAVARCGCTVVRDKAGGRGLGPRAPRGMGRRGRRRCRLPPRAHGGDLLYGACIGSLLGTTYLGFVAVHHGLVCVFGTAKHRRVLPRQQGAAQASPSHRCRPRLFHVPVRLVPGMLRATVKTRDSGCRVGPVSVVDPTANRSVLITRPAVVHAVPARHACGAALSRANELMWP